MPSLHWVNSTLYIYLVQVKNDRQLIRQENQNARDSTLYRGMEVLIRAFLTSALEVSGQSHVPTDLPPRKNPPVHTEKEAGWVL